MILKRKKWRERQPYAYAYIYIYIIFFVTLFFCHLFGQVVLRNNESEMGLELQKVENLCPTFNISIQYLGCLDNYWADYFCYYLVCCCTSVWCIMWQCFSNGFQLCNELFKASYLHWFNLFHHDRNLGYLLRLKKWLSTRYVLWQITQPPYFSHVQCSNRVCVNSQWKAWHRLHIKKGPEHISSVPGYNYFMDLLLISHHVW